jgi:DNA-binding MarR family transcriptional regulator
MSAYPDYIAALHNVERLQPLLSDLIRDEFENSGQDDITGLQALFLFNIGDAAVSPTELVKRGCPSVHYNLKRLTETGYAVYQRSPNDRRSVRVKLTDKGKAISEMVGRIFERHLDLLKISDLSAADLKQFSQLSMKLGRLWAIARH